MVGFATVVAGTAVGLTLAFVGHRTPPLIEKATPGTTSVTPKWLPPGATFVFKGTAQQAEGFPGPLIVDTATGQVAQLQLQLAKRQVQALKGSGAGTVYALAGAATY